MRSSQTQKLGRGNGQGRATKKARWEVGDDPEELWTPVLSRVYGLHPWDVQRLTVEQYNAIGKDVKTI